MDLLNVQHSGELTDYLINFVNHMDPNVGRVVPAWPEYDLGARQLLHLLDAPWHRLGYETDTYRKEAMEFLTKMYHRYPLD